MQPPWLADTAELGLFHPQREADQYAKQLEGTRSILMSSVDRVAHIDGQLMQLLWAHTRFQRSINAQSNKTEQSIYECLLGFCFNNISAPPQILPHRQFSSAQFQKRRNDGWWFPLVLLPWFVLNSKRLLSTSRGIKQASAVASSIFFMVLFLMLFEVRRIVCVEN